MGGFKIGLLKDVQQSGHGGARSVDDHTTSNRLFVRLSW